ncbi:MAG: CBS domain-containing protein [Nisaea sp.]|jgi:CBS domain-containing protein|uniref:CBS domain-containing protein n=1 Tax=Nisaea sp. TaxID=2024842 RepID=UPI001B2F4B45|nr:CBS domain-containing protein [Nisaea sp.]MBO6560235.1 CBS domain-containing protein [Nisaea sp.]
MLRCVVPDVVTNQDLLTLPTSATVEEAALRMTERRVRSVLVVEEQKLVGIFTGTDLIERVVAAGMNARVTCLGEVMSTDPQTIGPDLPAIEALRMMQAGGFRHLPVLRDGKLVAVLSRRDFAREEEQELELEEKLWEEM